ncbi:unnamed protein product [Boreogadus saida]
MSFHLIKFANGDIAVVPENWCDDGMVYWPKYKNTERAKRAAANRETPESNWPKYDIMVIRTCGKLSSTSPWGRTATTVAKTTLYLESYSRNGSPSSSPSTPSTPDINPEPAANRGAFFNPRHRTNMARGKNEFPTFWMSIPCSAAELHILNLLETIKQQQDQLVAKVNYLCSKMNCTPGPEVEMPENINLPLEHLEAVEAFEVFLKEPSNHPARQRIIASLATIGGHDVKRVTWNILGRLYSDDVSHQINWKGVNHKKAFSQMSAKSLLFSVVRKNSLKVRHRCGGHQAHHQMV